MLQCSSPCLEVEGCVEVMLHRPSERHQVVLAHRGTVAARPRPKSSRRSTHGIHAAVGVVHLLHRVHLLLLLRPRGQRAGREA